MFKFFVLSDLEALRAVGMTGFSRPKGNSFGLKGNSFGLKGNSFGLLKVTVLVLKVTVLVLKVTNMILLLPIGLTIKFNQFNIILGNVFLKVLHIFF